MANGATYLYQTPELATFGLVAFIIANMAIAFLMIKTSAKWLRKEF